MSLSNDFNLLNCFLGGFFFFFFSCLGVDGRVNFWDWIPVETGDCSFSID